MFCGVHRRVKHSLLMCVFLLEIRAPTSFSCFSWFYRMFPHQAVTFWGSLLILFPSHWHLCWQGTRCLCWLWVLAAAIWCLAKSWYWVSQYNYSAELIIRASPGTYSVTTSTITRTSSFITCQAVEQQWNVHLAVSKKSHSLPSSLWVIPLSLLWIIWPWSFLSSICKTKEKHWQKISS